MKTITIKTNDGGQIKTHYEFTESPRNLLKAIETLHAHSAKETSWIEINSQKVVDRFDLEYVMQYDAEYYTARMIKTRIEKAREMLADYK